MPGQIPRLGGGEDTCGHIIKAERYLFVLNGQDRSIKGPESSFSKCPFDLRMRHIQMLVMGASLIPRSAAGRLYDRSNRNSRLALDPPKSTLSPTSAPPTPRLFFPSPEERRLVYGGVRN